METAIGQLGTLLCKEVHSKRCLAFVVVSVPKNAQPYFRHPSLLAASPYPALRFAWLVTDQDLQVGLATYQIGRCSHPLDQGAMSKCKHGSSANKESIDAH
jgi:hypothetical protein